MNFFPRPIRAAFLFLCLVALWYFAYKLAELLNFWTYSSLWFLPAGATLATVLVAPRPFYWAPLVANLLLAIPLVSATLGIDAASSLTQILHSARHFGIYAGCALFLREVIGIDSSFRSLRTVSWLIATCMVAAVVSAGTGVALHIALGNMSTEQLGKVVVHWSVGDFLGLIIVVPLLAAVLAEVFKIAQPEWRWPSMQQLLVYGVLLVVIAAISLFGPTVNPSLTSLWHLMLVPTILMAAWGGMPLAVISIHVTGLVTPMVTHYLSGGVTDGFPTALLVIINSVAALLIAGSVSDRKASFRRIVLQRQRLAKMVEERTHQLTVALDFQKHLVRSLGHDLQQPIQSLNLMLQSAALQTKDDEAAATIEQSRRVNVSASEFVSSILEYSKMNDLEFFPVEKEFEVSGVFDDLGLIYAPIANEKQVRVIFEITRRMFYTDRNLLMQALSNFLDNAIRSSTPGKTVQVTCSAKNGRVEFLVVDEIGQGEVLSGAAGYGHGIIDRIAQILGAQIVVKGNSRGLAFEGS